jgi:hypothetical protein
MLGASYAWQAVCADGEPAFAQRDGGGGLVFDGKMWLIGGWNWSEPVHFPRHCCSEVWSSEDGVVWTLVTRQAPWEGRHCAGYCVHGGRMWVVGGDANQGHYQPDVWCSSDGKEWSCVCSEAPWCSETHGQRIAHITLAHAGHIYVLGGQNFPGWETSFGDTVPEAPQAYYGDVWRSKDGAGWEQVATNCPWSPRGYIGGSAVMNGRLWLIGGGTYETPAVPARVYKNDVWSSSDGVEWVQETDAAPWQTRHMHETAVFDDKLWVLDGFCGIEGSSGGGDGKRSNDDADSGCLNDVWWSEDGKLWHEVEGTPWPARHASTVFVHRGSLWLAAGSRTDVPDGCRSDVWRLVKEESAAKL